MKRKVIERFMLEFLHSHTNVVFQPPYNSPRGTAGLTPTRWASPCSRTSSASVSRPRKRISTGSPISPVLTGWKRCISPCATLRMKALSVSSCRRRSCAISAFFTVLDDDHNNYLEISAIHNEEGYREIRNKLSAQYNLSNLEPNIHGVER